MTAGGESGKAGRDKGLTRGWFYTSLATSGVGLALSAYSISHHLIVKSAGSSAAVCNISARVNCDAVAKSAYSEWLGIPLGVWGLGFYLTLALVTALAVFAKPRLRGASLAAYGALVHVGLICTLFLAGIAFFALHTLCLVCLGIYLVNLVQGGLWWARRGTLKAEFSLAALGRGAPLLALPLLAVVLGFYWLGQLGSPSSPAPATTDSSGRGLADLAPAQQEIPIAKSAYAALGEDYRRGSDEAKVVLVAFSDFQCPACRSMSEALAMIGREYGEQVLLVYRNFPLDNSCNAGLARPMHPFACKAAVLARCAGQYEKFWQYHDKVFREQEKMSATRLEEWARELGLSDEQISTCLASKGILEKIKDDISLGEKLGVDATPTLYLNGRKVINKSLSTLRAEIDKVLASKGS